ncbi:MAG: class B sortase [Lachnospiraceae bacterium]|nr:class B sortase [Lachnospiraceae bacterium]
MKANRRVIIIILATLSVICLLAGVLFWVWDTQDVSVVSDDIGDGSLIAEEAVSDLQTEPEEEPEDKASLDETDASGDDNSALDIPEFDPSKVIVEEKVENPYKEWFLKNSDMVAWIKIPDTCVDYPVMWTPEDEEYYLRKDFYKKYDKTGTPFLDSDSSIYPASTNLIIYGHNFKDVMFYDVLKYEDEEYFKAHPYLYLYEKDCEHVYAVMSAFLSRVYYTTDTCFKYYKFFNASTEEEFLDFYDNVKELSFYDTGITAEYGDKFVTLSTCSDYLPGGVGRFVLVAKEIENGEKYLSLDESTEDKDSEGQ